MGHREKHGCEPARLRRALIGVAFVAAGLAVWLHPRSRLTRLVPAPKGIASTASVSPASRRVGLGVLPVPLPAPNEAPPANDAQFSQAYAQLPLSFETNQGQTARGVKFLSRGDGYVLFLTAAEAVLSLRQPSAHGSSGEGSPGKLSSARVAGPPPATLRVKLIGANGSPQVDGLDELPGKSNYFIGNDPRRWRANIPNYARVKYRNVYPGVDLVFHGRERRLEYDFVVASGADAGRIQLAFEGASEMTLDANGDLVLRVAGSEIRQKRPVVYQEVGGHKRLLSARYELREDHRVSFELAGYDPGEALVIDPVLAYSSFLGGSGLDSGHGIALDPAGNAYVTGETVSTNFSTQAPYQSANAGGSDAFVTKLDPTGTTILYSTYLGGSGNENDFNLLRDVQAAGVAVDSDGNIYLTGRTSSTDFPVMNALLPSYRGGDYDAFVAKLSADGSALLYSSYLGGSNNDSGNGIAVDAAGNVYVTGGTRSDTDFPITPGAYQRFSNGNTEAYVTKIDPTKSGAASLIYSTFLGGQLTDRGTGIAVDASGNAYITGLTDSADYPTTLNAFQTTYGGARDAFVTKLNAEGTDVIFSTYLGGSGLDQGQAIVVDVAGNVFLTGETASADFPTAKAFQATLGGSSDSFVAQLDPTGMLLLYSTFLGGSGPDSGHGIALDSAGKLYVTGATSSGNFPSLDAFQTTIGGGKDAFVAKLDPAQDGVASLVYSSFLGGSADESAFGIAVNSAGDAWVVGQTASANFPTANPVQATYGGGLTDAFVARISGASASPDYILSASPPSRAAIPGGMATYTISVIPAGGFTGTVSLSVNGLPADASGGFDPVSVAITDALPKSSRLTLNLGATLGSFALTITGTSGALEHSTSATLVVSSSTGPADVSLTKTSSPNPVTVHTNLTYSITTLNQGPSVATGVIMTDTLPSSVTLVPPITVSPSGAGTCSGTSTITCDLGTMAVGNGVAVVITVSPQATGRISNIATVRANEVDPNPTNNSATAVTAVENPCPGSGPCMADPNLSVRTVVSGLTEPTGIAFLGPSNFLVLEKSTGKVKHVVDGLVQSTVLDLAVNSNSERGLLGIALHPDFAANGFVYLYWTCRGPGGGADCDALFGEDTGDPALVPLLGNRVDRFIWDGSTLTLDQNMIRLRSYQADADANGEFNQPLRGNHNGGKIVFGPDRKLYILIGDNGRRGWMQNIANGVLPGGHDDQFGGPEPDNAHLTGVILRLKDDGTTPDDNPFFAAGAQIGGEAGANIQKVYAYGVRNSFGMAFDPISGLLWNEENGDDSFDEINLVSAGANNGWVQIMGPVNRIADYKGIETSPRYFGIQQVRWPPTLIADTPSDALARLFMLSGAFYNDPLFSWKYAVAPSPIGFVSGDGLGPDYNGSLFVGAARTFLAGGYLFRFKLTADRRDVALDDPRLMDRVADNTDKFDITESESLLAGRDFGITTDLQTGPDGHLYVVSLSRGAVYEVFASPAP